MTSTFCGRSMMSWACGATSTLNGDFWRISLKPEGLAGIRSLSEKSGFLLTGLIGLVTIWKKNFVLMGTLWRGRLGVLHRTSFGSYANQIHPWSFRVNKGFSLTCMPKSGKKNKSYPLNLPAIRRMYLWGDERRGSKLKKVPWRGSQHSMGFHAEVLYWSLHWCGRIGSGHLPLHWDALRWSNTLSFLEAGVLG